MVWSTLGKKISLSLSPLQREGETPCKQFLFHYINLIPNLETTPMNGQIEVINQLRLAVLGLINEVSVGLHNTVNDIHWWLHYNILKRAKLLFSCTFISRSTRQPFISFIHLCCRWWSLHWTRHPVAIPIPAERPAGWWCMNGNGNCTRVLRRDLHVEHGIGLRPNANDEFSAIPHSPQVSLLLWT